MYFFIRFDVGYPQLVGIHQSQPVIKTIEIDSNAVVQEGQRTDRRNADGTGRLVWLDCFVLDQILKTSCRQGVREIDCHLLFFVYIMCKTAQERKRALIFRMWYTSLSKKIINLCVFYLFHFAVICPISNTRSSRLSRQIGHVNLSL